MTEPPFDLNGKLCPFIIMHILREVGRMRAGETMVFLVDDPLAIKSVPEELEDNPNIRVHIEKVKRGWEITIAS